MGNADKRKIQLQRIVWRSLVYAGAFGGYLRRRGGSAKGGNGRSRVVLCLRLVLRRTTTLAACDAGGIERQRFAQSPGRLATQLYVLLEILGLIEPAGRPLPFDSWVLNENAVARLSFARNARCLRRLNALKSNAEIIHRWGFAQKVLK